MKRKIVEFLIIIFFYVLQVTLGRVIAIGGIKPDFLVILPVLFGFLNGRNEGMYVGFIAGIMYDLYFSGLCTDFCVHRIFCRNISPRF